MFIPAEGRIGVEEKLVDFQWYSGFAVSQKKKSINAMHSVASSIGYDNLLEISSKSDNELGVQLSAFNLTITTKKLNKKFSVECAFQGSKVFENGGPYRDLFETDSLSAKKDLRVKSSGNLVSFQFFNHSFPIVPRTYFYDWIYINALLQNSELADSVLGFNGFTDIEFNPQKSINCQAHSVALYVSLLNSGMLNSAIQSPQQFLELCKPHYNSQQRQIPVQQKIV